MGFNIRKLIIGIFTVLLVALVAFAQVHDLNSIIATGDFTFQDTGNVELMLIDQDTTDKDVSARISVNATTTSSGNEDVNISLKLQEAGTEVERILIDGDGAIELNSDVTIREGGTVIVSQKDADTVDDDSMWYSYMNATDTGSGTEDAIYIEYIMQNGTTKQARRIDGSADTYDVSMPLLVSHHGADEGKVRIYEASSGTNYVELKAPATLASNTNFTLPNSNGSNGQSLISDGAGNLSWSYSPTNYLLESLYFGANEANVTLDCGVNANQIECKLRNYSGGSHSSSSHGWLRFRSETANSGASQYHIMSGTQNVYVLPSGSTLGCHDGIECEIHIYASLNSGTAQLCYYNPDRGGMTLDEGKLYSSTTMSGSANNAKTLYCATGTTNKAIRYVGRILTTQATAGTYASALTEVASIPFRKKEVEVGWKKYTITDADLTAAATNQVVVLDKLPPKVGVSKMYIKLNTQCAGPGMGSCTTDVGYSTGSSDLYLNYNLNQVPSDTLFNRSNNAWWIQDFGSYVDVQVDVSSDVNVNTLTALSFDIYIKYESIENP